MTVLLTRYRKFRYRQYGVLISGERRATMDDMTKKAVWKGICALLALMLVMALAATAILLLWPPGNNGSSGLKRAEAVLQAVQPKAAEMQTRSQIQIAGAELPEDTEDEIAADRDYIIPDSSRKVLEDADIEGLSAKELNYARNEILQDMAGNLNQRN